MTRLKSFIWTNPGVYSITVPYTDINDFWFSGHIGTCLMMALEFRAMRWYKASYMCIFVLVNQWIMMTLTRAHYIIDLITGLIFGHYFFMLAEWVSYYVDVKVLGVVSLKRRGRMAWIPCKSCGQHNRHIPDYTVKEEAEFITNEASKAKL